MPLIGHVHQNASLDFWLALLRHFGTTQERVAVLLNPK